MPERDRTRAARERNSTADRTIDVLLLFNERQPVLSASEVSRQLGMPRSTTYRYLQTLRSYGFIEDDEAHGGIRLGPRVFQLARVARQGLGLSEVALPAMRRLAAQTGEAVLLTRRSGTQVVCVERVESEHPVRLSYERGHVLPLHAGASAKVILAFTPPAEVDGLLARVGPLPRFTDRTVTDPSTLREQLAEIRGAGYAVSHGEVDEGVLGIAAPILWADGRVAAGLSVAALAQRIRPEDVPQVVEAVVREAEGVSQRLQVTEA